MPDSTRPATVASPQALRLNSERIAERFGDFSISVIDHSDSCRRALLWSGTGVDRCCRTYAISLFDSDCPMDVVVRTAIADGASIGHTLRQAGFGVQKHSVFDGVARAKSIHAEVFELMQLATAEALAFQVYELLVSYGDSCRRFATIGELYHPQYIRNARQPSLDFDADGFDAAPAIARLLAQAPR